MNENKRMIQDAGIRFFGSITASISHEVKNILAIINENAGLLEDLLLMHEKGGNLDTERIKNLADKIRGQVKRGDGIIKNMNRFAHSVDHLTEQVDLNELLALMVVLVQRMAFMKGVSIEPRSHLERIIITTNAFLLENLIWECLDFILNSEPCPGKITVVPNILNNGARVCFSGLTKGGQLNIDEFRNRIRGNFLDALQCDLYVDEESGDIVVDLPKSI